MAEYINHERDYNLRKAFDEEYALDLPCIGTIECVHHTYEIKAIKNFYKHIMIYKAQGDYEKQLNLIKRVCYFIKDNIPFLTSHYEARLGLVEILTELIANERASSLRAQLQSTLKLIISK